MPTKAEMQVTIDELTALTVSQHEHMVEASLACDKDVENLHKLCCRIYNERDKALCQLHEALTGKNKATAHVAHWHSKATTYLTTLKDCQKALTDRNMAIKELLPNFNWKAYWANK